jgi:hypothetical protein
VNLLDPGTMPLLRSRAKSLPDKEAIKHRKASGAMEKVPAAIAIGLFEQSWSKRGSAVKMQNPI